MQRAIPWIIGILVLVVIVAVLLSGQTMMLSSLQSNEYAGVDQARGYGYNPYLSGGSDFAPDIEERQYSLRATIAV